MSVTRKWTPMVSQVQPLTKSLFVMDPALYCPGKNNNKFMRRPLLTATRRRRQNAKLSRQGECPTFSPILHSQLLFSISFRYIGQIVPSHHAQLSIDIGHYIIVLTLYSLKLLGCDLILPLTTKDLPLYRNKLTDTVNQCTILSNSIERFSQFLQKFSFYLSLKTFTADKIILQKAHLNSICSYLSRTTAKS